MEGKIHVQSPCLICFCLCLLEAQKFSFVAKMCARQCYEARGWDIPIQPNSWNKAPCGQFIKEISVWYLTVNKRYGRRKNRVHHKKSTQGKHFLIIMNSCVQPQRKVVLWLFFFYKYIISQCIWEKKRKKSSSRIWVAIQRNIYMGG